MRLNFGVGRNRSRHPCEGKLPGGGVVGGAADIEVADIFRAHGAAYRCAHPVSIQQQRAMRAIERCRTAALGGHVDACDDCGHYQISYNSCRNRFCPKCQGRVRAEWVEAREADLLPIGYFHIIFTLPHALNPLVRQNSALVLNLFFRAVTQTLLEFGREHLKGEIGVLAVLHTWGQTLCEHYHLHTICTGGALSADLQRWNPSRPKFLFPVQELATVYRTKFCDLLRKAHAKDRLGFHGDMAKCADADAFRDWLKALCRERWIVYAKAPFASPAVVVRYLGRYTHRGPIANSRLTRFENGRVRFSYKDYREDGRWREMELSAEEFIRRYLLHVLPRGFIRIRYYGLYAHARRKTHLVRARELLMSMVPTQPEQSTSTNEPDRERPCCEACGSSRLVRWREWRAGERPPTGLLPARAA
jgi:hypothetical protein